jgi:hypothetical protein
MSALRLTWEKEAPVLARRSLKFWIMASSNRTSLHKDITSSRSLLLQAYNFLAENISVVQRL